MSDRERHFLLFLEDISSAIEKIENYTAGLSYPEFRGHSMAVDAVIRNFEVIGEAVKNIPSSVKSKYPHVEWKEAAGFRDVLIHAYFGIDVEALWETIHANIPTLKKHIQDVYLHEREARYPHESA